MTERIVCLRLVPGLEGQWIVVRTHGIGDISYVQPSRPTTTMVATGNVEWDGDRCAEVYVPENRLAEWRAEHDVEDGPR